MIIFADLILFILLTSIFLIITSFLLQQGYPLWASPFLGLSFTYLLLISLSVIFHWVLRVIVGKNPGYLPSWKVPLWGIMAGIHYFLFFTLQLFLPREFLPKALLRLFGLKIGSNSVTMGIILDPEMVEIGNNVFLEPGAILSGHIMSRPDRSVFRARVVIEDGVRIGNNSVIAPGVHIAADTIVLPNSYVPAKRTLESGKTYGGNPATNIDTNKEV
ncbi:MAG: acyltransferase [Candidatus Thorarchaeota archaeon]